VLRVCVWRVGAYAIISLSRALFELSTACAKRTPLLGMQQTLYLTKAAAFFSSAAAAAAAAARTKKLREASATLVKRW
jgi:hypothetical protein